MMRQGRAASAGASAQARSRAKSLGATSCTFCFSSVSNRFARSAHQCAGSRLGNRKVSPASAISRASVAWSKLSLAGSRASCSSGQAGNRSCWHSAVGSPVRSTSSECPTSEDTSTAPTPQRVRSSSNTSPTPAEAATQSAIGAESSQTCSGGASRSACRHSRRPKGGRSWSPRATSTRCSRESSAAIRSRTKRSAPPPQACSTCSSTGRPGRMRRPPDSSRACSTRTTAGTSPLAGAAAPTCTQGSRPRWPGRGLSG